jgi:hypothetical protein
MFYCEQPPLTGGATTLCDGAELLDRLPTDIVEFLRANQLVWSWSASPERWHSTLGADTPAGAQQVITAMNRKYAGVGRLGASFDGDRLDGTYTTGFLTRAGDPARDAFCNSLLTTLTLSQAFDLRMTAGGASATLGNGSAFPRRLPEHHRRLRRHGDLRPGLAPGRHRGRGQHPLHARPASDHRQRAADPHPRRTHPYRTRPGRTGRYPFLTGTPFPTTARTARIRAPAARPAATETRNST